MLSNNLGWKRCLDSFIWVVAIFVVSCCRWPLIHFLFWCRVFKTKFINCKIYSLAIWYELGSRLFIFLLISQGKYIVKRNQTKQVIISGESSGLIVSGQQHNLGYYIWMVLYFIFILPFQLWTVALTWFFVVSVPVSKLNWKLMQLLIKQPACLAISAKTDSIASMLFINVCLFCFLSFKLFRCGSIALLWGSI